MRRIFLVGCPRSGTTLVQSLLASAPGMVTFTESHFFDKCFSSLHYPLRPLRYDRQCVETTLRRFDQENNLQQQCWDEDAWSSANRLAQSFIRKLDDACAAQSATGWIEKTPDHLRRIRLIRSAAPEATFVHVLRNPAETISSLRRASQEWGKPRGWLAFAIKWSISVAISANYQGKPGHVHVYYEDIIDNSRGESKRLFDELGLMWDENVLERYSATAKSVIAPYETWKKSNIREIGRQAQHPDVLSRFQLMLLGKLERHYQKIKNNAAQRK